VNPRALIFDMDGVIVDSEALHESAKRQALRSAGIEVDELVFAQYTGRSDRAMITDLAKVRGCSDDEVEAILLETQRLYALGEPQLRPITGVIRLSLLGAEALPIGHCHVRDAAQSCFYTSKPTASPSLRCSHR
jgi:beta-phosphoglucomutase-like phosphatase (HAD superfamily)